MAEILIAEGHNGGAVSAKPGDVLVIQLQENPTTGFRWSAEVTGTSLQPESDDFRPGGTGMGAFGIRVFRYLARTPGEGSIALQLARPWEPTAPRSQFRIRVSVSP